MNHTLNYPVEKMAGQSAIAGAAVEIPNLTIRENLDRQIEYFKGQIEYLEGVKKELGPLLEMKSESLRRAISY